jgi:hypothetical protein
MDRIYRIHTRKRHSASPGLPSRASRRLALAQGAFYLATGVWPLVHMRSFEVVTGPKVDRWLVRTVGGLLGVVGGALGSAARHGRVTPEIRALGAGTAAVLAVIDCTYVARKRISPIYLLDAAAEVGLVAGWAVAEPGRSSGE